MPVYAKLCTIHTGNNFIGGKPYRNRPQGDMSISKLSAANNDFVPEKWRSFELELTTAALFLRQKSRFYGKDCAKIVCGQGLAAEPGNPRSPFCPPNVGQRSTPQSNSSSISLILVFVGWRRCDQYGSSSFGQRWVFPGFESGRLRLPGSATAVPRVHSTTTDCVDGHRRVEQGVSRPVSRREAGGSYGWRLGAWSSDRRWRHSISVIQSVDVIIVLPLAGQAELLT